VAEERRREREEMGLSENTVPKDRQGRQGERAKSLEINLISKDSHSESIHRVGELFRILYFGAC